MTTPARSVLIPYAGINPKDSRIAAETARRALNALAPLAMAELFKSGRMRGCGLDDPKARDLIIEILVRANFTWAEILSPRRDAELVAVRHECVWTVKKTTALSLPKIGVIFHRDHTSILNAIRQHQKRLDASEAAS